MYKFGSLVAGLEMLRVKEEEPDWEAIGTTLKEMTESVSTMQTADTSKAYQKYTDELSAQLKILTKLNNKKDKKIYNGFDTLTQTCFQCHACHRPTDFLEKKVNRDVGMK